MNIGFPRARAGENAPDPIKLEITVQPVENNAPDQKEQKEPIDLDYGKDGNKNHGHDYEYDEKHKTVKFCSEDYCTSNVITVKSCDDLVCHDLGNYHFKQNGFILELSITLKDVCPGRRTALAVILYELDKCGREYIRGFKTVLVPATGKCVCDDICVKCLRFVLPDSLDISEDCNPCGPRRFVVRYTANYVDSDFSECGCIQKDKYPVPIPESEPESEPEAE
jgi:hypothetical protein